MMVNGHIILPHILQNSFPVNTEVGVKKFPEKEIISFILVNILLYHLFNPCSNHSSIFARNWRTHCCRWNLYDVDVDYYFDVNLDTDFEVNVNVDMEVEINFVVDIDVEGNVDAVFDDFVDGCFF